MSSPALRSTVMQRVSEVVSKRLTKCIVSTVVVGSAITFILSPYFNQMMGDVFFGKVQPLYNVTLAQFFFERAAYPFFGRPAEYAHYQLSRTYFIQGDLRISLDEAQKELETYPDHVRTQYIIGLVYGYLNEEEKAIQAFETFIAVHPTSWAARNDKAWLQFRIGDIDGALETILPVTFARDNPWVQNTYGTLLMNKERYDEAKKAFLSAEKAIDSMSEEQWGRSYPGNDPRIYATGLNAMRSSIKNNLELLNALEETINATLLQ